MTTQNSTQLTEVMDKLTKLSGVGQNDSIARFIDQLIDERGYTDLLPEIRNQMRQDIALRLDDFVMARIISVLSDVDLDSFEKLLEKKPTNEELQKFVTEHVEDLTTLLTNTLLEFKGVYLGIIPAPMGPVKEPLVKQASEPVAVEPPMPAPVNQQADHQVN